MARNGREHRLFSRYPDAATATLPSGDRVALPYHCYDAEAYVIHGTVEAGPTRALLAEENCRPVLSRDSEARDRAIAQIWLNVYHDTNVGPYRELVISFAVSLEADPPVFAFRNRASLLAPAFDPRCATFTRWLFLDSQRAIDLGREAWGFPKYRASLHFDRSRSPREGLEPNTRITHRTIGGDGKTVVAMFLELEQSLPARLGSACLLIRALGIRRLLGPAAARELASSVLTPVMLKQLLTRVITVGRTSLHRWSPRNELNFGRDTEAGRALAELDFEPLLVQRVSDLKFVMLPGRPLATHARAGAEPGDQPLRKTG
ncbi:MAG: acetoacetate decarboxylase family protein [Candidatus Krumholzibacteriia bacterium]